MKMTRRETLLAGSSLLAFLRTVLAQGSPVTFEPRPGSARLAPEGAPETPIWGYGGKVPGPEIRVMQGQQVSATLSNGLAQPTTVHWHGIRIENAMDGVTALTQDAVQPGQKFDYRFTAPDAGTFWYHPHDRTWEQMARGLYGPLIVEEKSPPAYDRDLVLMLDDWRLNDRGAIDGASFGSLHDWSHSGRLGNRRTVNGRPQPAYPVRQNERIRFRLITASCANVDALTSSFAFEPARREAAKGDSINAQNAIMRPTPRSWCCGWKGWMRGSSPMTACRSSRSN